METLTLAARMKLAASKIGGSEALRKAMGLSNDTFYRLMRGGEPRTTRVQRAVHAALRDVGIAVPRDSA